MTSNLDIILLRFTLFFSFFGTPFASANAATPRAPARDLCCARCFVLIGALPAVSKLGLQVVGLGLLVGALTAVVLTCTITTLRRRRAGDYISLDPTVRQQGHVLFN